MFDHILVSSKQKNGEIVSWKDFDKHDIMDRILKEHVDQLYRYIRFGFFVSQEDSEDIVQEIFVKIRNKIDTYDQTQALAPWLFTIAHHTAIDRLRRHQHHHLVSSLDDESIIKYWIQATDLNTEQIEIFKFSLLHKTLSELSERDRQLIVLYFLEARSYKEIAQILDIKETSVGTLLSRAKQQLKNIVQNNDLLHQAIVDDLE